MRLPPEKNVTYTNTLELDHSLQKEVPHLATETRVLLMRHGETPGNKKGIVQGWGDEALSTKGKAQIAALNSILSDKKIDTIYTSDLKSALESAELIGKEHSIQVQTENNLREQDLGVYQGTNLTAYLRTIRRAKKTSDTFCPEGGEVPETFRKRAIDLFLEIIAKHQGKTILLITHTGVIKCILHYLFGNDLPGGYYMQILRNAAVTDLKIDSNEIRLKKIYTAV